MKPISSAKFIEKAGNVHSEAYDYSKVVYTGSYDPVEIICPSHGSFFQKPNYHILRKSGCPQCYRQSQKYTEAQFLERARAKFGERYTYGVYVDFKTDMSVTCNKHNHTFTIKPATHVRNGGKGGCMRCRSDELRLSKDQWVSSFVKTHGTKYSYDAADTIQSNQKLTVVCPEHGPFYPTASNHAKGHGCPTCACNNYIGGYSAEFFAMHPERKQDPGILYLIKIYNDTETFFKVGITNQSIKKRFTSKMPYSYDILLSTNTTLYDAHLCETLVLSTFKAHQYIPKTRFPGWTECISLTSAETLIECITANLQSLSK